MTRNATTGEMNVFVNGTHRIQAVDTTFNHSEKFAHYNFKYGLVGARYMKGLMFDNITADDTITMFGEEHTETTTPTETETTTTETPTDTGNGEPITLDPMLLAVGGGAVVVLLVIVVIVKRK
jgi:hypothetical protein